ncbi:branched-chain amino acid ABC transporter permease [Xylophilus sp. GOD-11R]|uniref:branched-chain amino acid ABC transporter permease n=1 Tax=Xylophilus sp. GOD-11R TaxID=3089814 RepID=UPI00298D54AC|nr:branched-chain amino acid ABC transporter permease [Xylophilus sp. GOD-11R]WPB55443.1 branched-chain amino acid ABC transporter permease [Xylophilus sp. GOD-11R]
MNHTHTTSPTPSRLARLRGPAIVLLLLASLAAPLVVYPVFMMKIYCFALFASAFNLLFGFAGLMSFGHAAFLGSAAYICGYSVRSLGFPPELGLLAGTATAAVLGFVVGRLAIRREGIYFSMVTLALAQMVYFICLQAPFTGSEDGIQGIPRGKLLGFIDLDNPLAMYYFVLAIFVFGFWSVHRIVHSPFGQVLKAIRENEPRAISLGYDVQRYKLVTFVLSASLAGLAGATKTLVFQLVTLTDVHWSTSGEAVLMTLVGGMGTIFGPLVGAAVVVSLEHYLSGLGSWVTLIMGLIFMACVLMFREGIVGSARSFWQWRRARREAATAAKPLSVNAEA